MISILMSFNIPLFLVSRGISVGIGDVTPGLCLLKGKSLLLEGGYTQRN